MEEDYDYVELHVTNVRKVESDRRRCIVSMQPNNDVREFMFFTDEYNAARIALRVFPEKSQMINTTLWSELTINALSAFDVTVKNYKRQGRDFPVYTCNVQLRHRYKRQYFRKCSRRGDDCA